MISKSLFWQTAKSCLTLWLILTVVQMFFIGNVAATGVPVAGTGMAYYNLLPGIFSGIYVIVTSNKLFAAQVDKGTMAYILSTPNKRTKISLTQATYFIGSLLLMFALSAASHIIATYIAGGGISGADVGTILLLNLGLFVLTFALSGIGFLASSIFNLSKYAIAVTGGLIGAFLVMNLMSMFGNSFAWMKNLTLLTLYDINSIMAGTTDFIWKLVVLAGIGLVTYTIGTVAFSKRDLPL